MRIFNLTIVVLLVAAIPDAAQSPSAFLPDPTPVTAPSASSPASKATSDSDKKYWKHAFGPQSAARAGLGAATNQGLNTPKEWGQGMAGFGKRFASSFAKHLVQKGIQYPVSKAFHEELSYRRSSKKGFGPRLAYALEGVVITHKTTNGSRTIAKGELSGAFGSGLISRLWQPASVRTIGAGFGSAGISLGVDAAGNVLREFWPEIRHPHSHNRLERAADSPAEAPAADLAPKPEDEDR